MRLQDRGFAGWKFAKLSTEITGLVKDVYGPVGAGRSRTGKRKGCMHSKINYTMF
jgi:hypothetical protein